MSLNDTKRHLVVFALILGILAIGIGGYNFYTQIISDGDEIGNTWYDSEPDFFTVMPAYTYVTFTDLTIDFSIKSGDHTITIVLYGSFNINGVFESTLFVQTFPS